MSVIATSFIVAISAAMGWRYGLRLQRLGLDVDTALKGRRGQMAFSFIIACSAALVLLSKKTDVLSPDALSLLNHATWGLTKGFLAFFGAFSVPLSRQRAAIMRAGYGLFALLGIVLVHRAELYVFSPIFPRISQDRRTTDGYVLQTQDTSCTAASLANLLAFYGLRTTEYACAKAMGTTRFGSTTGDLVKGIRQFGLQAVEVSADPAHLGASKRPAILSVWNSQVRHSVVWAGQLGDGTQIIIDPLAGRREIAGSELWNSLSSSRAIALSRPLAYPLKQRGRIPEI